MDQSSRKQQWLNNYRRELESKINELNMKLEEAPRKKKPPKGWNVNERAERIEKVKLLTQHLERLRSIKVEMIQDDSIWDSFKSLLETLFENVDNNEHSQELLSHYELIECSQGEPYQSERLNFFIPEYLARPLENSQIFPTYQEQNTLAYKLKMMDISYKNISTGTDHYPPPQEKLSTKSRQLLPKYKMISHNVFQKYENETLFYIFYFSKEPYEQYLASRELKSRQWLFHKKFSMWLKKDSKFAFEQTEEHIKGSFVYFDFERTWQQKKKSDFMFKTIHLDNEQI